MRRPCLTNPPGRVLAIEDPPPEDAELEERDGDDDEHEDEGHRRPEADAVRGRTLEERPEDEQRHRAGRVQRATVRQYVDLRERPHGTDRRDDPDEEDAR